MGRVLMNISLTPNAKPEKGIQALGPFKEPPQQKFCVRCDLYEINGTTDFGEKILVKVQIGGKRLEDAEGYLEKVNKKKEPPAQAGQTAQTEQVFVYRIDDQVSEVVFDLPIEESMRPDVFVSVCAMNSEKRLGYVRLKSSCKDFQHQDPKWYQIKGVLPGQEVNSFLLMNLEVLTEAQSKKVQRPKMKKSQKIAYMFQAFIYAAYDLAEDTDPNEIRCQIEMSLGGNRWNFQKEFQEKIQSEKKRMRKEEQAERLQTQNNPSKISLQKQAPGGLPKSTLKPGSREPPNTDVPDYAGRNPIWNQSFWKTVNLEERLEFSSNLTLQFFKNKKEEQGNFMDLLRNLLPDQNYLGECTVKVTNIKQNIKQYIPNQENLIKYDYQFYPIMKNGACNGRILACFVLVPLDKVSIGMIN